MKTVTLDEEAYDLLRAARLSPRESFSSVVKRALGRRPRLEDSAGAWQDVTDDEVLRLRQGTDETFGWVGGSQ